MMARPECEDKSREMVSSSSGGGFCYSEHHNPMVQGFVSDDPEMFNLTTGMEMIGFSKNQSTSVDANAAMWKTFFSGAAKPGGPSSSYQEYNNKGGGGGASGISETSSENHVAWQVEDSSSVRCVFPCEGNERPSQGLSLSLSSSNPSSIGLQSFELRHATSTTHHHPHPHTDFVSASGHHAFQQQASNLLYHHEGGAAAGGHFMLLLKNSSYLLPAQELLNEFCGLATRQGADTPAPPKNKHQWQEEEDNSFAASSSSKKHTLSSLEFVELQKKKTKLLSMLQEVERRYRNYRTQMKAVVSSFEAVAGNGAATVYSAMALKAMSRHYKRLKEGILGQIQVTRKAMGEKDPVAPGTTRGETPRLKIIDQTLRQQRAFQQMSMMETHPWRPQRGLPERSVSVLRAWLFEHFLHPYPSDVDKHILARQTGLSRSQVSNWFINARVRLWKPMVEEMYMEEVKERENNNSSEGGGATDDPDELDINPNNNNNNIIFHNPARSDDQKPTPDRLLPIDSECASSMLNNQQHCLGNTFGSVELDFSSYAHHTAAMLSYTDHHHHPQQGGGVSLTLGLQQHGGSGGVSLAFPPGSGSDHHHGHGSSSSLLYPIIRDQIHEDHHHHQQPSSNLVQYSLLDGDAQNLPYRNLMGAQLLHDLAG